MEDLIRVERGLGYRYEIDDTPVEHYQWICPPCRRAMLALAQGALRQHDREQTTAEITPSRAMPRYANPGFGEGPLGVEDRDNFHP